MEKIKFMLDTQESVEFFVLEQTRLGGKQYILVTDAPEGDADALILRESPLSEGKSESIYEVVEDDTELSAVAAVFENLLDDTELL